MTMRSGGGLPSAITPVVVGKAGPWSSCTSMFRTAAEVRHTPGNLGIFRRSCVAGFRLCRARWQSRQALPLRRYLCGRPFCPYGFRRVCRPDLPTGNECARSRDAGFFPLDRFGRHRQVAAKPWLVGGGGFDSVSDLAFNVFLVRQTLPTKRLTFRPALTVAIPPF